MVVNARFVFVTVEDSGTRLDHWLEKYYPGLPQGKVERLIRTGQIRVDGRRAHSCQELNFRQLIRIPPFLVLLSSQALTSKKEEILCRQTVTQEEVIALHSRVLYQDEALLVINKPAGLPVQGGSGVSNHLDGILGFLRFEASDRPRLVHRLDRDTSGVLLVARTASVAATLSTVFRKKAARKIYWAVVVGVPQAGSGRLTTSLFKDREAFSSYYYSYDKMRIIGKSNDKLSTTDYRVVKTLNQRTLLSWLELIPHSGRTHQLRVHCAALGTPILGDIKYNCRDTVDTNTSQATTQGIRLRLPAYLHLHARSLVIPHPLGYGRLHVSAPLPLYMARILSSFI